MSGERGEWEEVRGWKRVGTDESIEMSEWAEVNERAEG